MSDYFMPPENGDVFLGKVAREFPFVERLLHTAAPLAERQHLEQVGAARAVVDKMVPASLLGLVVEVARERGRRVGAFRWPPW